MTVMRIIKCPPSAPTFSYALCAVAFEIASHERTFVSPRVSNFQEDVNTGAFLCCCLYVGVPGRVQFFLDGYVDKKMSPETLE